MKKNFTEAEVTVNAFELEDVITVSTTPGGNPNCPRETPDEEVE